MRHMRPVHKKWCAEPNDTWLEKAASTSISIAIVLHSAAVDAKYYLGTADALKFAMRHMRPVHKKGCGEPNDTWLEKADLTRNERLHQ
jgi:hypothetical protein